MDAISIGTMQGLSPEAAALLVQIKNNVKLAQTLGACGFAICLWDTLAYLHVEYRVVWKAKWSFIKAAYLFTRYITMLTGILYFIGFFASFTPSSCNGYVKVFPAMGTLPLLGCTLMLTARLYKLWDDNKILLGTMLFFSVVQFVGQLAVALVQTIPVPVGNGVKACVPTTKSEVFIIYWILPTACHFLITIFTFIKAWELAAMNTIASGGNHTSMASRIWNVVFSRYGLVFPICFVVVETVQIIFYLVADDMQRAILSPLSGFLITVLACQMVLIYRLTSRSGMSGLNIRTAVSNTNQSNSNSKDTHPSVPTFISGTGRLRGVQAFVTSHQAIDDEKDLYGTRSASSSAAHHHDGSHSPSILNVHSPQATILPQMQKNAAFSSSDNRRPIDRDLSDSDSISEADLKASSEPQVGAH